MENLDNRSPITLGFDSCTSSGHGAASRPSSIPEPPKTGREDVGGEARIGRRVRQDRVGDLAPPVEGQREEHAGRRPG